MRTNGSSFVCEKAEDFVLHAGLGSLSGLPITDLNLYGCDLVTDTGLALISGLISQGDANPLGGRTLPISTLSLNDCSKITDAGLRHLAFGLATSLKKLSLARCNGITNGGLGLFEDCPRLVHIDVTGCRGITVSGTEFLAETVGPRLEVTRSVPRRFLSDLMVEVESNSGRQY